MRSYPPEALKRIQSSILDILDAIANVCDTHGISWYLAGGSCLGAARHQGFIPWDDDIDIGMMRPDYDRFLQIAPEALPNRFQLVTPENTPGYSSLFSKVCMKGTHFWTGEVIDAGVDLGIFVDVFPRDHVAADPVVRRRQDFYSTWCTRALYLYHSDKMNAILEGPMRTVSYALFPLAHKLVHAFTSPDAIRRIYYSKTSLAQGVKDIGTVSFTCPGYECLPGEMFEHTELVPFEGRLFPAPNPCEEYCRLIYGESWMELPPVEKRWNHAPVVLDFGDGVNVMETA